MTIHPEVAAAIDHHVHILQDPRNQQVFYVGEGVGDRVHAHEREALTHGESEKLDRIRQIHDAGLRVRHLMVRSALRDDEEAFAVEQALTDAPKVAGAPLTDLVQGHGATRHGLSTVGDMIGRYGAAQMPPVERRVLFVKINRAYLPTDGLSEIYEATRGRWKLSERGRNAVTHAAGVAHGVIHGVYRIRGSFTSQVAGDVGRWASAANK